MSKKKVASANVDDLLDGNGAAEAPAEKSAKVKRAAAPAAKKAASKKAAAPAAKKAAPKKAKADEAEKAPSDSALRKALLKVRKAVSYADFAEANDFPIRSVRRTARAMRDAGEIQLSKEGTAVFISAAV